MSTANKKELAIVAITRNGACIGRTIKTLLPASELYIARGFAVKNHGERSFSLPVRNLISNLIGKYRELVLIMATGIAVRLIAPHVTDKHSDAGVVAVDDSGKFVISLLSGHAGGANELALKIASLTGAQPVITTASDMRGFTSLDLLAKKYRWEIEDIKSLTQVQAVLVNGEEVAIYQDAGETGWLPGDLSPNTRVFPSVGELLDSKCGAAIFITDRLLDLKRWRKPAVIFYPKSLVVGVGCNRGAESSEIEEAMSCILTEHGLKQQCIRSLATADIKRNEDGILEFAEKYNLPIKYFSKEKLVAAKYISKPSPAALKYAGVPSVCEAAAMLAGGKHLIVPKSSYNRKITLAVSRVSKAADRKSGKLFIVGIGPGDPKHMTIEARRTLAECDVVVGYNTYIDLCRQFLTGKEIVSTSMGKEIERVNKAIDLAVRGKKVSLISSGDPGIYGMSGLAAEMIQKRKVRLDVKVVPGVPAMVSAAALLVAPLNVDVASVSLSDHLVHWPDIATRLDCAAKSNFVIAVYNPRSKSRKYHLAEARNIILKHRGPSTPVGIVSNAYRPRQNVTITDLQNLTDFPVDMDCIVIIGNSSTRAFGNWMVTPRGYSEKYTLIDKPKSRTGTHTEKR